MEVFALTDLVEHNVINESFFQQLDYTYLMKDEYTHYIFTQSLKKIQMHGMINSVWVTFNPLYPGLSQENSQL